MEKKEVCPYYGKEEFVEAKHSGYANVFPASKIFTTKEQAMYYVICLSCGTVVRSFVKDPHRLVVKK